MINRLVSASLGIAMLAHGAFAQATATSAFATDSAIRSILIERIDKQHQSVGIVVGLIEPTGRRIVSYGGLAKGDTRPLDGNTVFEIGSISKVFTSVLLADMVRRGDVALDDPVAKYLPATVSVPERAGHKITLVDLATHSSGLPRMPSNFKPKDNGNPYADYTVDQMYQFLSGYTLTRDIGAQFEYSNFGVGLLGNALTRRAGMDYEALVRSRIADPLGMTNTRVTPTADMKARFATGYDPAMNATPYWDLPTFAGAGALRSTANDMLTFLAANIGLTASPLSPAMTSMLAVRRPAGGPGSAIGLGWLVASPPAPMHEVVWHNGGTGGFRSFVGFDRERRIGVVVLSNAGTAAGVDDIGMRLLNKEVPLVKPPEKKEHKEIAIDQKLLDGYLGKYDVAPGFVITIARVGNHLSAQATGQGAFEIFPEGNREFFAKVADIQIAFETDAQGKATAMILTQMGTPQRAKRID